MHLQLLGGIKIGEKNRLLFSLCYSPKAIQFYVRILNLGYKMVKLLIFQPANRELSITIKKVLILRGLFLVVIFIVFKIKAQYTRRRCNCENHQYFF